MRNEEGSRLDTGAVHDGRACRVRQKTNRCFRCGNDRRKHENLLQNERRYMEVRRFHLQESFGDQREDAKRG